MLDKVGEVKHVPGPIERTLERVMRDIESTQSEVLTGMVKALKGVDLPKKKSREIVSACSQPVERLVMRIEKLLQKAVDNNR